MWSFGTKLWGIIRSAFSAKRGHPYISVTLPIPAPKPKPMLSKSRWEYIVIHHSFSTDTASTRNWTAICKYHVEVNGWASVGYHLGLEMEPQGMAVHNGRPLTQDGAHALGFNRNGIGICLVGNYDNDPPSEIRMIALSELCLRLMRDHGIPATKVIGHRETYGKRTPPVPVEKSCPGQQFDMDKFRKRLTSMER